jgi:DNA polymerase I-like protein with 3'-5' exonuclease and polymerase domains
MINGVEMDEVDKEMRQRTKTVVYGWQYGQAKDGLSKRNNLAPTIVAKMLRGIRASFAVAVQWRESIIAEWYRRKGWSYTYFGRGRYLPTYNHPIAGREPTGSGQRSITSSKGRPATCRRWRYCVCTSD